jgi:hypothetical protein
MLAVVYERNSEGVARDTLAENNDVIVPSSCLHEVHSIAKEYSYL